MRTFLLAVFILLVFAYLFTRPASREIICKGEAGCIKGNVEEIMDGDTIVIDDNTVRLSLVNTPEKSEPGYNDAKVFTETLCPIGSSALVDEDDMQTSRTHRRIVGIVYCNKDRYANLNKELVLSGNAEILVSFCNRSEFSDEDWARSNGC